tara:strand:+ start:837 stop:1124 length:288 start_codon:yes stop_codon:yes gene_type:complete
MINNVTKIVPTLPLQCNEESCNCRDSWDHAGENHIVVYCQTYRAGSQCDLSDKDIRWSMVAPIDRETFYNNIQYVLPELKKYKEWKKEEEIKNSF